MLRTLNLIDLFAGAGELSEGFIRSDYAAPLAHNIWELCRYKDYLLAKYDLQVGSSASGIDLPPSEITILQMQTLVKNKGFNN
jgi:hypothetical protein